MKLLQLSIHNIASIEDAFIDFANGPLGEDSQFLICGPTGAGKTTLLDAICLALYGTTPRLQSTRSETYVDHFEKFTLSGKREDIKIDDPRMLMRRGSLDCAVELTFTDKDDVLLKSVWTCSRTHNKLSGNVKASEWMLIDVKEDGIISSKKTEVQHLIEERIGVTFEQFCRTTMLAQGDFTRFLKSEENKKSEILEKLTGTAVFSEIGTRIYQKKIEKETARNQVKSRLEGVQLMTEEEREACTEQGNTVKGKIVQLNQDLKVLQTQMTWMNQWNHFQKELNQSLSMFQHLNEKIQTDTFKKEEEILTHWDQTITAREWWRNRAQAEELLQKKVAESKQLAMNYQQLCAGLSALQQQQRDLVARRDKIISYIEKEKPMESTYQEMGVIKALIAQRKEWRTQVENANGEIEKILLQLSQLTPLLQEQQLAVEQGNKRMETKQKELEEAAAKLESLDYNRLLQERNAYTQEVNAWKDYQRLTDQLSQALQVTSEKKQSLQTLQKAMEVDRTQQADFQKKEQVYQQQVECQQQLYDKQKLACEDLMKEYRSHLKVGEVCPLCGQKISSLTSDEHFVSILQPVQESLLQVQKQLQEAQKGLSEQSALLVAHQQEAERVSKEYQLALQKEKECTAAWQQHAFCADFPMGEGLKSQIEGKLKELSLQIERKDVQLKAVGQQQQLVATLQKEKREMEKQLHLADEEAKKTEKKLTEVQRALTSQQTLVSNVQKSIHENSLQLEEHLSIEEYKRRAEDYIKDLQKGADLYQKAHDTLESVEKKMQLLTVEEEHIQHSQSAILTLFPRWKELPLPPAQPLEGLSAYWVKLQSLVAALQEVCQQARHQQAEATAHLTAYFSQPEAVTESVLAQLMTLPSDQLEAMRQSHQSLRDELLQAKTRIETARTHLEAQEAQKPAMEEGITVEDLLVKEQSLKEELEAANQQSGKIQQCLENDEENKKRFARICQELEGAEKEYNRWAHLSNLFGSAKGDKFRNIAQSYVLEQLLVNANQYLYLFTDRYEMECQPGSLTILLKDKEAGGVLRPTSTISGGESFLISLSLALGLSSLSRSNFSMDTLFIDEGFGTLDSSYLSTVIDALERLHQIGGKKIGIISHVESLKERITTQIQVSRVNSTLSKVEVVSLV